VKKSAVLLLAVVAFLAGVLGAAVVLSAVRGGESSPAALDGHEEHGEHKEHPESEHGDHRHEGEEGVVRLSPEGIANLGLRTEPVARRLVRESLSVPATVEAAADAVAKVTPPAAGKVVRTYVRLGDAVKAGQPVAVLDSFEIAQAHAAEHRAQADLLEARAGVQTARAEVGQARARLTSAQKALATQQELAKAGAFSQAPLQAAQTELAEAQSELLTAQTELQSHTAQLQRSERLFKEGIISRAELEQAQLERRQDEARAERAQVRVEAAKRTLERERRVAQAGLLNRQALQAAEAEVHAAEAEVARARREEQAAAARLAGAGQGLEAARANLIALEGTGHIEGESGKITLYAPIDGVIAGQSATHGETVERGSTLFQIENLTTVMVQASVPEKDASRVRAGLRVEVTVAAFPDRRFSGVVQSLASRVDPKTRALPVRCLVANPDGRLRPEMFATVSLPTGTPRRALTVPEAAVVTDRGSGAESQVVFVAQGEEAGTFEKRRVTTASVPASGSSGLVEVTAGLKEGEQVVTEGAYALLSEANKAELAEGGHAH